jgi:pectinesterase
MMSRGWLLPSGVDRRFFLQVLAGAALVGCTTRRAAAFDAVVSLDPEAGDGVPVYASVGAALAAAPAGDAPYRLRITRGRWREKLVIDRPGIELIGDNKADCVLSFDAAAGQRAPDGEPWGTWRCASVTVRAPDFRARRLTMENAFDYAGHLRHPVMETVGSNGAQAVALMLDAGADRSFLQDVILVGHQDTLFVDAGRSLFRRCTIHGSVDFVFGAGAAWFEQCDLVSRFRYGKERQGYVAVPSTLSKNSYGLVFHRCQLHKEAQVPKESVALGRAWRPTRNFADGRYGDPAVNGAAAFIDCWMDDHIDPAGWDAMSYTARDGSRVMFQPLDARLVEFRNAGPGAAISAARRQLDASRAVDYSARNVLDGWSP